jgi:hypothetical protein
MAKCSDVVVLMAFIAYLLIVFVLNPMFSKNGIQISSECKTFKHDAKRFKTFFW